MTWQPEITFAGRGIAAMLGFKAPASFYELIVRESLRDSGALKEIDRLTALLAMKDETIKTLRQKVLKETATTEDDYDSGYRAVAA